MKFPQRLFFSVRKRVIALKPAHFQRFQPAETWTMAELKSRGYAESTSQILLEAHLHGNLETAIPPELGQIVIDAFSTALSVVNTDQGIRVLDLGGFDGAYADVITKHFCDTRFHWTIVELPMVVNHFTDVHKHVSYSADLHEALLERPDVIFASAVLNYLPDPYKVLESFFDNTKIVIINRQPLWPLPQDQCAVQTVQRKPFLIQYPTWFFSKQQFLHRVSLKADVLAYFEVAHDRAYFKRHYGTYQGLVLRTKIQGH